MNELNPNSEGAAKWQAPTPPPAPAAPVASDDNEFPARAAAGWQPLADPTPDASEFPAAPAAGLEAPTPPATPANPETNELSQGPKDLVDYYASIGEPSFLGDIFNNNKDQFTNEEATNLLIKAWENARKRITSESEETTGVATQDSYISQMTDEQRRKASTDIDRIINKLREKGYYIY